MLEKYELTCLLDMALNQISRKRKSGNELVYFCPKCHHYKRKLEVCLDENNKFFGAFHCWTCNLSGNLYDLLGLSPTPERYKPRLAPLLKGIRPQWRRDDKQQDVELTLPSEFIPLSERSSRVEYKNAMAYLRRRRVLYEDILRYNIGYCESGKYEQCIVVPSYDACGNLNFFIARQYYDSPDIFAYRKPEVSVDNIVGFESFVNYKEPLNLVEGCFDAFAVRNNAIPLFGKYLSKKLREAMQLNHTKRVNMILDNDALDAAVGNYVRLHRDGIEVYLVCLDGKDPSEMGFERTHELIHNACEFDDMEMTKYNLSKI
jgi:hypothetical protein